MSAKYSVYPTKYFVSHTKYSVSLGGTTEYLVIQYSDICINTRNYYSARENLNITWNDLVLKFTLLVAKQAISRKLLVIWHYDATLKVITLSLSQIVIR